MSKKWGRNKQIIHTIELKQKRRFKTMLHDAVLGYVGGKLIKEKKSKSSTPTQHEGLCNKIGPEKKKPIVASKAVRNFVINNYTKIFHGPIHQCEYCGEDIHSADSTVYTIDHLVPTSFNGVNTIENMRPCCKKCNLEKANFTIDEWLNILYREFQRTGESDPHIFYKFMRVRDVKRYVDRMGELLYVKQ